MLTLDLLRYRVDGDTVTPIYLTLSGGRRYMDVARLIVDTCREHIGRTLGEMESALEDALGAVPDYKVYRGLAKMMGSYVVASPPSDLDAEELRARVFALAGEGGPVVRKADLLFRKTAADRLDEIAHQLDMSAEQISNALYADLPDNRVIRETDSTITAEQLIHRYNTALAQAMLYRATRMIVDVYDGYRGVFKHIKLARLIHSIRPHENGYRIEIDGPMSLFANVERYGIAMARVLPAVLKCGKWRLAAKVNVPEGGEKLFRLSPRAGLTSHYRDQKEFDSSAEEAFYRKFSRNTKSKWTIEREGSVLDLKETIMIPDFKLTHADGTVVHLEIVGFWTPEYLAKKLDRLSRVRDANVVVAVPDALACAAEAFTDTVVRFHARLLVKDVLPALEAFRV